MTTQTLDRTFAALADPTRREIVNRLVRGPAAVSELAEPFSMSLPAVLKHVRVLEQAGVVRSSKVGRVRRCELTPERVDDVADWLERLRRRWERRLDRLEEQLKEGKR